MTQRDPKNRMLLIPAYCVQCSRPFLARQQRVQQGMGKFCSESCYHKYSKGKTTKRSGGFANFADKFWSKVNRGDSCWEWQGRITKAGYGATDIPFQRAQVFSHRVSYALTYGPIPRGWLVCHHCDNPRCVRPDHLFLGTHADNTRDMMKKGRDRRAKLTASQVQEIRKRWEAHDVRQEQLAKEYGVRKPTIAAIVRGITWRHLL